MFRLRYTARALTVVWGWQPSGFRLARVGKRKRPGRTDCYSYACQARRRSAIETREDHTRQGA